ncbi:sensor histidine kinase [Nonomuraea sp. NPDC050383]|uniref:sensor histidine kinase n=1 Tax=Nonomuraea sp. NPDC050383 TaxID=3364362 RepID=UPI0037BC7E8C
MDRAAGGGRVYCTGNGFAARLRSVVVTPMSPLWLGRVAVTAGLAALTVPVQAALTVPAGSALTVPVGAVVLMALLAVHARFVLGVLARREGGWWLVGAQAWLTYLPMPWFGAAWTPVCGLLSGALLVTAYRVRSAVLVALAAACGPVLLWAPPGALAHTGWAVGAPVLGLAEYAVVTLAGRAHWLAAARNDVIGRAVALERRRFTRDLHDLVGHRLTALVLKAQLVERLVREGDPKAEFEVGETLVLLRALASDVRSVAHGGSHASLESEVASARALLESVGVRCDVRVSCRDFPGEVAEALVHVLREGVTNILRHAAARRCVIRLDEQDRLITLSIRNDGARPVRRHGSGHHLGPHGGGPHGEGPHTGGSHSGGSHSGGSHTGGSHSGGSHTGGSHSGGSHGGGHGLGNMTERLAGLGGWLETDARGGEFAFSAFIPRANGDRITGQ